MARLPNPGSDVNRWGEILNDFLRVEHSADGTLKPDGSLADVLKKDDLPTKGSLMAGTGGNNVTSLSVGSSGQVLTVDTTQPAGLSWKTLPSPSPVTQYYPLAEYGMFTATGDPLHFGVSSALSSGDIFIVRLWVPAGNTISAIKMAVQTASAQTAPDGTPNQFVLYDDEGTQVAATADDPTMWTNVGWYTGVLPSTVPAQTIDRFVYIGLITGGHAASSVSPAWPANVAALQTSIVSANINGKRRSLYVDRVGALPASFDPHAYGTETAYVPLLGLAA